MEYLIFAAYVLMVIAWFSMGAYAALYMVVNPTVKLREMLDKVTADDMSIVTLRIIGGIMFLIMLSFGLFIF